MNDIKTFDWKKICFDLSTNGYVQIPGVLSEADCATLQNLYQEEKLYRSVIKMERYRFGKGEYKYFQYPLPDLVQKIRQEFYPYLSAVANHWMEALGMADRFPDNHDDFINRCHAVKQMRPTPLILRYEAEGYNTLHQDLYGEAYFPFQVVFVLSERDKDFHGGEFVLVEQVPRAQSRVQVFQVDRGDALIFTTNFRPVKGAKGYYRAKMKHGISRVKSGVRFALGVIFHDAA